MYTSLAAVGRLIGSFDIQNDLLESGLTRKGRPGQARGGARGTPGRPPGIPGGAPAGGRVWEAAGKPPGGPRGPFLKNVG